MFELFLGFWMVALSVSMVTSLYLYIGISDHVRNQLGDVLVGIQSICRSVDQNEEPQQVHLSSDVTCQESDPVDGRFCTTTHEWVFHREGLPLILQNRHPDCGGCVFVHSESDDDSLPTYRFEAWTIGDEAQPYHMDDADKGHFLDVLTGEDRGLAAHIANYQMNPHIGG